MMKRLFLLFALLATACATAQELTPSGKTPIYRRSFTAVYELTGTEPVREASFSPDKTLVAFVRDNDLFVREVATGCETRITSDGERNKIINGATDWVYEEEYMLTRAYEFSPDSRRIAFLRFDESRVPEFTMMRYDGKLYTEPYTFKYPKAGEPNSVVTLHVYDIQTGEIRKVDTGTETDQYIPRIGWTPAKNRNFGSELFFYRVNRLQNLFEVVLGDGRVIYSESSPRYVERPTDETVTFLPDGDRFIVKQETRSGWMHLYLHSISKGFLNPITSGEWEVTELLGVEDNEVRYISTEVSPLARAEYTVKLDGRQRQIRSEESSSQEPNDGREFFTFTTEDDFSLNGWIMKPAGFDPSQKYPVFMSQYSGPGSQSVSYEAVHGGDMMIYKPLLEAGYIVACVDGRGTGFRGEEFKKCTYGDLGSLETEDQIAAARHLAALPFVDPARIGIYGWSYGGFIALNSILKGADVFALAVAVAPVTSWRYYDTIYTEIYNGLPQDNPAGYDENSPINYAHLLQGKLLLVHGTGDDNVHIQNGYEMAKALVAAGKEFDMMVYPDDNHSMMPAGMLHVRRKIVDYVKGNL